MSARARGRGNREMLRPCCALLALLAMPFELVWAADVSHRLLDRAAMTTFYPGDSDIVTAYATGMARYRLALSARVGDSNLAIALEPRLLRAEFRARTWRAADGSLLQGFAGNGGFRLTVGNCLARMCAASECSDAGWPIYMCSDGRSRKMVVSDFTTATFGGIAYRRLSVAPSTD
jgi:hypothetical protein